MMKRHFDIPTYRKLGCPDLGAKMFFRQGSKKIYGTVVLVAHNGFRGARKNGGMILIGLKPFKQKTV